MAKGQKYGDELKERAYAEYAICGNCNEVSRKIGVPYSTVKGWINKKPPDELDKLRDEKKKEFIDSAGRIIKKGMDLLNFRLQTALDKEQEISRIIDEIASADPKEISDGVKASIIPKLRAMQVQDIKSIAITVGTIYDKRALAEGDVTERSESGVIILPEIKEE